MLGIELKNLMIVVVFVDYRYIRIDVASAIGGYLALQRYKCISRLIDSSTIERPGVYKEVEILLIVY
jgi:hypothetical protein